MTKIRRLIVLLAATAGPLLSTSRSRRGPRFPVTSTTQLKNPGEEVNPMTKIRRLTVLLAATAGPLLYLAVETAGGWRP
jgi:hypothetical protein